MLFAEYLQQCAHQKLLQANYEYPEKWGVCGGVSGDISTWAGFKCHPPHFSTNPLSLSKGGYLRFRKIFTHSYLYFTYDHSTKEVIIIPELPSLILPPLFMLCTTPHNNSLSKKEQVCTS
jgi:hypothetical protein